jgi:23S rRNA (pseudouridine1915-N3)-methyltransferase
MTIAIAAVGRLRRGPVSDLLADYEKRLTRPVIWREVEERRPLPPDKMKAREAGLLRDALPAKASLIALDERGKFLTSRDFADALEQWTTAGGGTVGFAIGGADGLAAEFVGTADAVLSLGAMTWPHMLVRLLLLEQLYRAQTIQTGHPYHRD